MAGAPVFTPSAGSLAATSPAGGPGRGAADHQTPGHPSGRRQRDRPASGAHSITRIHGRISSQGRHSGLRRGRTRVPKYILHDAGTITRIPPGRRRKARRYAIRHQQTHVRSNTTSGRTITRIHLGRCLKRRRDAIPGRRTCVRLCIPHSHLHTSLLSPADLSLSRRPGGGPHSCLSRHPPGR